MSKITATGVAKGMLAISALFLMVTSAASLSDLTAFLTSLQGIGAMLTAAGAGGWTIWDLIKAPADPTVVVEVKPDDAVPAVPVTGNKADVAEAKAAIADIESGK